MARSATAQAALEALWAQMIELAEAGNDAIVLGQANPSIADSARIAALASDLASLAQAAATLARGCADEAP